MGWIPYIWPSMSFPSVALFRRAFVPRGVMDWYPTLSKACLTPGGLIGVAWSMILHPLGNFPHKVFTSKGKNTGWFWSIIGPYLSHTIWRLNGSELG
jgi:hypothetical protein